MSQVSAITLDHITKRFGDVHAVDDVSLVVPEGSVYGFIGPNGSGKTTTLRMIMHILLPDSGRVEVLGRTDTRAAHDDVGYLPEERGLYKKMSVRRLLRYYGALKGRTVRDLDVQIARWLERLQLTDWIDKPVETLSKGMSQKVQFIATVVAQPRLVILDEPFSGLDPVNAETLKDAILELRRNGTTIVFSTHDMSAAERLCDRIFMIYRGRTVLDGTLDQIQERYGFDTVRVRTTVGRPALDGLVDATAITDNGNEQEVRLPGDPQAFLAALITRTAVQRFELVRPSLHDIFVRIARPSAEPKA